MTTRNFHQQKRGWTCPLACEGGVHPLSPDTLVSAARAKTHGALVILSEAKDLLSSLGGQTSSCPALLFGSRDTRSSRRNRCSPCVMQAHQSRRAVRRLLRDYFALPARRLTTLLVACSRGEKSRSPLNLLSVGRVSTDHGSLLRFFSRRGKKAGSGGTLPSFLC